MDHRQEKTGHWEKVIEAIQNTVWNLESMVGKKEEIFLPFLVNWSLNILIFFFFLVFASSKHLLIYISVPSWSFAHLTLDILYFGFCFKSLFTDHYHLRDFASWFNCSPSLWDLQCKITTCPLYPHSCLFPSPLATMLIWIALGDSLI